MRGRPTSRLDARSRASRTRGTENGKDAADALRYLNYLTIDSLDSKLDFGTFSRFRVLLFLRLEAFQQKLQSNPCKLDHVPHAFFPPRLDLFVARDGSFRGEAFGFGCGAFGSSGVVDDGVFAGAGGVGRVFGDGGACDSDFDESPVGPTQPFGMKRQER